MLERASAAKLVLAAAESCTGGMLASLVTDVEGMSSCFHCGVTAYSAEAKTALLGVPAGLIERHGAVSAEAARAMAEGMRERSGADVVVAITGFAGRAGPEDEAGLVHFACWAKGGGCALREKQFGDIGRGPVRVASLRVALAMMLAAIAGAGAG